METASHTVTMEPKRQSVSDDISTTIDLNDYDRIEQRLNFIWNKYRHRVDDRILERRPIFSAEGEQESILFVGINPSYTTDDDSTMITSKKGTALLYNSLYKRPGAPLYFKELEKIADRVGYPYTHINLLYARENNREALLNNVNSTNSKQSKLCVKCTLYIDTRLFWKHAVRRNRPQYVYDEIVKASVSGMLHLRNVFQFVVYRLYNSPFPKQQFVRHTHQSPLHVTFEFCNKLYTVNKHASEEVLADIALVCNQLSVDEFDKRLILQRFPVIDITRSYHEVQQLAFLVTYQMQFETEKPSHGTLAPLGYTLEYLVDMYPLIPAYPQRGAVHETYACAFSKQHFLNEKSQWYCHFFFKLHKTVV